MSMWSRYASTDAQEESIQQIEEWLEGTEKKIVGAVTIGKAPQSVILDLTYHGGEIHVNREGEITVNRESVNDSTEFLKVLGIKI